MNTIYIIISGLAALVVGWFAAKRQGRKEERQNQEVQNAEAKKQATKVQKQIDAFSDDAILDAAKKWVRK